MGANQEKQLLCNFASLNISVKVDILTCLRPILPYWMIAEAEAWTPNMALLLFGSCCAFVSYAVTMAVDGDKAVKNWAFHFQPTAGKSINSILNIRKQNILSTGFLMEKKTHINLSHLKAILQCCRAV